MGAMAKRTFVRQYDLGRAIEVEPGGGPVLVEVDQAYEKTDALIARMLEAGIRLEEARRRGFDFADGVDTGPTPEEALRSPGTDLADISFAKAALEVRLTAAEAAAAKKAADLASQQAASEREALKAQIRAELAAEAAKG